MNRKLAIVLFAAGFMVSCAPLSREIMNQVDDTLTYQVVQQDPDWYVGKMVLWGGVIVEITNKQSETDLKVRQTELDVEKRPKDLDRSAGRFIVRYAGFLDPAIYRAGRLITVAGKVDGREAHPMGNIQYFYPVLQTKEIHLWESQEYMRPAYPYYWDYPYWHRHPWGWYWPW